MPPQKDLQTERIPVFCTANLSLELLQDFTSTTSQPDPDKARSVPTVITSTNFDEELVPKPEPSELWIKPFLETGSPFLNWTPLEVRNFYVENCTPYEDFDAWPLGTFGILDSLSVLDSEAPTHRTILLCSSLPDFKEELGVWLKTCRLRFEDFASETLRLETLTTRPSELGKAAAMSFMPPLFLIGRDKARHQVSFDGLDNEAPYTSEHMEMQGGSEGNVRFFVRELMRL